MSDREHNLPNLELRHSQMSKAVTYSFWFKGYSSWANFTINDGTGEFSVQSDWGSWAYRWHTNSLGEGKTLTHFLLECDADYIVNKFKIGGAADLKDVVDPKGTLNAIKERIDEAQQDDRITKQVARALWLAAVEYTEMNRCDATLIDSDLCDFLNEPHEYTEYEPSHTYVLLVRRLIPFFQDWLKDHLANELRIVSEKSST